jgi:hypothetical protein
MKKGGDNPIKRPDIATMRLTNYHVKFSILFGVCKFD